VKPPRLGVGECGPCHDFVSYTLAFALQMRKITENLSQGKHKEELHYLYYSPNISTVIRSKKIRLPDM
jgi:hypothetical protein